MSRQEHDRSRVLRVGRDLELNLATREARFRGRRAKLTPIDVNLLEAFIRSAGRVMTYAQLADECWRGVCSHLAIQRRVAHLRLLLGHDVIRTVRGVGYTLGLGTIDTSAPGAVLQVGPLTLDIASGAAVGLDDGAVVFLWPRAQALLTRLMRAAGRIVSDTDLMRAAGFGEADLRAYRLSVHLLEHHLREIGVGHMLVWCEPGYRLRPASAQRIRRVGPLELDLAAGVARRAGRPIDLFETSFALLDRLTTVPGALVSRAVLLDLFEPETPFRVVDLAMLDLQIALDADGAALIGRSAAGYWLAVERLGLLVAGRFVHDPAALSVQVDDREEQLGRSESTILELTFRGRGLPVALAALQAATGHHSPTSVLGSIRWLREKLRRIGALPPGEELLVHVPGAGYRLAVERLDLDLLDWPLRFGGLRFQPAARVVRWGTRLATLHPAAAAVLEWLMQAEGGIVDIPTVIAAGGTRRDHVPRKRCLRELREMLAELRAEVRIEHVPTRGYGLINGGPEQRPWRDDMTNEDHSRGT